MEGHRGGSRVFVVALPTLVHMAWAVLPPVADERTDVPEGLLAVHLRAAQLLQGSIKFRFVIVKLRCFSWPSIRMYHCKKTQPGTRGKSSNGIQEHYADRSVIE